MKISQSTISFTLHSVPVWRIPVDAVIDEQAGGRSISTDSLLNVKIMANGSIYDMYFLSLAYWHDEWPIISPSAK